MLKERERNLASLSETVTPTVDLKTVTESSSVQFSARGKAKLCISREYRMDLRMFSDNKERMLGKQQRLTPEALAALTSLQDQGAKNAPLDAIPEEEPE